MLPSLIFPDPVSTTPKKYPWGPWSAETCSRKTVLSNVNVVKSAAGCSVRNDHRAQAMVRVLEGTFRRFAGGIAANVFVCFSHCCCWLAFMDAVFPVFLKNYFIHSVG